MQKAIQKTRRKRTAGDNSGGLLFLAATDLGGLHIKIVRSDGIVQKEVNINEKQLRKYGASFVVTSACKKAIGSPEKLAAVIVEQCSGSFTNLRLTVSVANTFGWLYCVPVCTTENWNSFFLSKKNYSKLNFIVPRYSKEPNITVSRKSI
ncbi:MAG: hypothetical protein WC817_02515 [Patescibacteria group bacterium]|jgi:hypothetical protein